MYDLKLAKLKDLPLQAKVELEPKQPSSETFNPIETPR